MLLKKINLKSNLHTQILILCFYFIKDIILKKLRNNILIILLSTLIFSLIAISMQWYTGEVEITVHHTLRVLAFILGVVTVGTFSFENIIKTNTEKFCSDNKAFLRFALKIIGIALISIPLTSLYIILYYVVLFPNKFQVGIFEFFASNIFINVIINYSFLLSDEALYWYKRWKKTTIDKNKIEKEKYRLEYENLKGHINPHFMFNSFAGLTSYIEKDKDEAIKYVEDLSDFFRNILLYKSTELIPLEEELQIAKTYFNLEKRRHKESILMSTDIDDFYLSKYIPPMSLQLLIENAIKHNTFSLNDPLEISIRARNDYLNIQNPYKPKETTYNSTKTGLENLMNTYKLLTEKKIIKEQTAAYFSVTIPLLDKMD